jgi:putative Holliday junction resolvase
MDEFALPPHHPLFEKKILALDWGSKFVGVACFHDNRDPWPLPFGRLPGGDAATVWPHLKRIIDDESVDVLVVGVPFFTDGKVGSSTLKTRAFFQSLAEFCTLPLFEQDETLSTFEAEERMKKSPRWNFQVDLSEIDAVAASVILEDFLRKQRTQV